MITCRTCGVEFPKPTTRGRPPVKCADCRAGNIPANKPKKRVPDAQPEPEIIQLIAEAAGDTPQKSTPKNYRSGFCGKNHAPEIPRIAIPLSLIQDP